jgi:predicted amidohydrolase YtcJ
MLQPYEGEPENHGMLLLDGEALVEIFEDAAKLGFGMTVHAIGDRANHEVLDAYALLRKFEKEHGLPHRRHRIEHLQVLHPADLPRPSEIDVVASMQPIHATSDMEMADRYWGDRTAQAYAWRTQLELGSQLAFGSDAPVETPDPIQGLAAAVTRRQADGSPGVDGWVPDQRIDIGEALAAYTTGAAYAAGTESRQGRLDLGYAADLVVLDRDPFEVESVRISELTVLGTMVSGDWSYRGF